MYIDGSHFRRFLDSLQDECIPWYFTNVNKSCFLYDWLFDSYFLFFYFMIKPSHFFTCFTNEKRPQIKFSQIITVLQILVRVIITYYYNGRRRKFCKNMSILVAIVFKVSVVRVRPPVHQLQIRSGTKSEEMVL